MEQNLMPFITNQQLTVLNVKCKCYDSTSKTAKVCRPKLLLVTVPDLYVLFGSPAV